MAALEGLLTRVREKMVVCRKIVALGLVGLIVIFPQLSTSVDARTWHVKPDGSGDIPTIQAAVDSAADGDSILLACGTFAGPGNREVDCRDKALTVTSESGDPYCSMIDCGGPGDCFEDFVAFYFRSSVPGAQRLEAVTITGGCGGVICDSSSCPVISSCLFRDNLCLAAEIGSPGAGLRCHPDSRPTITNCTFLHNSAAGGGGIYSDNASPTVINTTFTNNSGDLGAGMLSWGGAPRLSGCIFAANQGGSPFSTSGGAGLACGGSPEIVNCAFRDNTIWTGPGGGLYYNPSSESDHLSITGCIFADNRAFYGNQIGGGAAVAAGDIWGHPADLTITNSTFCANWTEAPQCDGSGLYLFDLSSAHLENTVIAFAAGGRAVVCSDQSSVSLRCCDIFGNAGGDWTGCIAAEYGVNGNFSADPLFCDFENGDLTLQTCSPCLPGHHPGGYDCGGIIGASGSGCECNAATVLKTWGGIKALFE